MTYNSECWLRGCVQALAKLEYDLAQLHLIFADNGSSDGTLALLAQLSAEYPAFGGFTVFSTGCNGGFGAGCNAGAAQGSAPYLLFLNVDTAISCNALVELDAAIAQQPDAGGWDLWQQPELPVKYYDPLTLETSWLTGAAMAVPRAVFRETGGFDEKIFMYGEDVDLSWRIRNLGRRLITVPRARFIHYEKTENSVRSIFAQRQMLLANLYLRRKYGTKSDEADFWKLYEHLHGLPEWNAALQGADDLLKHCPRPPRLPLRQGFRPEFTSLSYGPAVFFSAGPYQAPGADAPLISVLIRTPDRPGLLRQTLRTLCNQSVRQGYEVIVAGQAPAAAWQAAEEFSQLPLRYVAADVPAGRSAAGNMAASHARGSYLCFLDAGDWLLPNYIETWQAMLQAHPNAQIFAAGSMESCGMYQADAAQWKNEEWIPHELDVFDGLVLGPNNPVPIQAMLFARELFETQGGLDPALEPLEGVDLWLRYLSTGVPAVCFNTCTSVFKTPSDAVEKARRLYEMECRVPACIQKAGDYPLCATMGALMERCWKIDPVRMENNRQAEQYRAMANAVAECVTWRLTRPLRRVGNLLGRLCAKLAGGQYVSLQENTAAMRDVEEYITFIERARHSAGWKLAAFLRGRRM